MSTKVPEELLEDLKGYCRNCGKYVTPESYKRPAEDYDYPRRGMIWAWRSPCCQDELSADPVGDICAWCHKNADLTKDQTFGTCDQCKDKMCPEDLSSYKGMTLCPGCKKDMEKDKGKDLEDLVAEAEYREDR